VFDRPGDSRGYWLRSVDGRAIGPRGELHVTCSLRRDVAVRRAGLHLAVGVDVAPVLPGDSGSRVPYRSSCGEAPTTRTARLLMQVSARYPVVSREAEGKQSLARSGPDAAGQQAGVSPSGRLAASYHELCVLANEAAPRHADGDRHARAQVALERPNATGSERASSQGAARALATHVDLRAPRCRHAQENDPRAVIQDVAPHTHHREWPQGAQAVGRGVRGRGGGRWRRGRQRWRGGRR
jgi:hypothetical protein